LVRRPQGSSSAQRGGSSANGGLVGAGLYVLTGVVSFHEVLILQAALDPFLTALFLYLLARALTGIEVSKKVNGSFAWAGVALGLSP